MKSEEIKKHIEIEGVILTPEALDFLRTAQGENNDELDMYCEVVGEAALFIALELLHPDYKGDVNVLHDHINSLSYVRNRLKMLKKP